MFGWTFWTSFQTSTYLFFFTLTLNFLVQPSFWCFFVALLRSTHFLMCMDEDERESVILQHARFYFLTASQTHQQSHWCYMYEQKTIYTQFNISDKDSFPVIISVIIKNKSRKQDNFLFSAASADCGWWSVVLLLFHQTHDFSQKTLNMCAYVWI